MPDHVLRRRDNIDDPPVHMHHFVRTEIAQYPVDFRHHARNVFTMGIIYGIKAFICSWIVKVDPAKIADVRRYAAKRTK